MTRSAVLSAGLNRQPVDNESTAGLLAELSPSGDDRRILPGRWRWSAATTPAQTCCSGRRRPGAASRAIATISPRRRTHPLLATSAGRGAKGRIDGARDGFRLPARSRPQAAFDRLPGGRRRARPELLRSSRLRGAARKLHGDRQGRCSRAPLVPARSRRYADRAWRRADLLVGIDVRVSDAVARHARAGRQLDRADQSADRAPPDRVWSRAWGPLGRVRVRLQRRATWSSPTNIPISAFPVSG